MFADGVWHSRNTRDISYPQGGNDSCLAVEDGSYWFRHRNDCIVRLVRRFPPTGPIYDIGGGNGFVTLALEAGGFPAVLLEPGSGAYNALRRGVRTVIQSTLEDAALAPGSLDAVGVFDVVEHVEHDAAFLSELYGTLKPGGLVYCTVPAIRALWSFEDRDAGHFRRYTARSLAKVMSAAGLRVEFVSYFFSWLIAPVFLCRTVPTLLGRKTNPVEAEQAISADHSLPAAIQGLVGRTHAWESARLSRGKAIPFGTSLICAARRS